MSSHLKPETMIAATLLVVAVAIVFLPASRFGFVAYDDENNVYQNVHLTPVTGESLLRFWKEPYFGFYTPVTYSLWTGAAALPGSWLEEPVRVPGGGFSPLDATAFHSLGIIVHAGSALLLFALLLELPFLRGRSPFLAAAGAAFWATHPLMAEPVAWVTGNNNVFAGFFALLALLLLRHGLAATARPAAVLWQLAATIAFLLALLAKPTVAALPAVAFVLFVGGFRTPPRALLAPTSVWLLLATAFLWVARTTVDPANDVWLPLWQRPLVAGDALAFYLGKIVLPHPLGIDYGRSPEWLRDQWWFYLSWMVPATLGAAAYATYRRRGGEGARLVLTGFLVFSIAAAPMLGFVTYYAHRFSTVADRYAYLGMVGAALVFVAALAKISAQRPMLGALLASGVLLGDAALCRAQTEVWRDSSSLFQHAILVHPTSMMAHNNLALVLLDLGDVAGALREAEVAETCPRQGTFLPAMVALTKGNAFFALGRLREAKDAYLSSIALHPNRVLPYENLAVVLHQLGETPRAKAALEAATTADGTRRESVFGIGMTMLKSGLPELGVPYILEAAQAGGAHAADASFVLGVQAGNLGDYAEAEFRFRGALERRPDWPEATHFLGAILARQGRAAEADEVFARARRLGYRPLERKKTGEERRPVELPQ